MKRYLSLAVCALLILGVIFQSGCAFLGGNVSNVSVSKVSSDVYTEEEIDQAIDVAKDYFVANFQGCTLKEIRFEGDDTKEWKHWAKQADADEAIVLYSDFVTGSDAVMGQSGLESNEEYLGWNWILVRDDGGQWTHYDHGY